MACKKLMTQDALRASIASMMLEEGLRGNRDAS